MSLAWKFIRKWFTLPLFVESSTNSEADVPMGEFKTSTQLKPVVSSENDLCLTVSLSLSHWYHGSDVVLDCIDS